MSDRERFDEELQLRGIVGFLVALTVITLLLMGLFWGVSGFLRDDLASRDPAPSPLPEANVVITPPDPQLQDDPELDMVVMQEEQDLLLNSYDWVDRDARRIRVPIAEAMRHVAAEGIPAWTSPSEELP